MTTRTIPQVLSATSLEDNDVVNTEGQSLGNIEDFMIDLDNGRVSYAVLSFGGFLGVGDKLFAIPWDSLHVDTTNERFVLDVPKEKLENAPGFDKSNWPNMADRAWGQKIYKYYDVQPYWMN